MVRNRETRTGRFLRGTRPQAGFDGFTHLSASAFDHPTFVPRLSFTLPPGKAEYSWADVCHRLSAAPGQFVCDSSIFDDVTDSCLWPSLLNAPGKLVLTPRVVSELEPWFERRPSHPVRTAMQVHDEAIFEVDYSKWPADEQNAYVHYVNLLALRKGGLRLAKSRFAEQQGRPFEEADRQAVLGLAQQMLGERGFLFAKKGEKGPRPRPHNFYTDEEVVYTAFALAVKTGRETYILTKDEDLLDQFYRLMYLLDTHYRSMLIARGYRENFTEFRIHPMSPSSPSQEAFIGTNNILVEWRDELPQKVLPSHFTFVPVHCEVLGDRHSSMTFGAEREMLALLAIKGSTLGLNSRELVPRNVHLSLPGIVWPKQYGTCFAVAEDHSVTLPTSGRPIPFIECQQAILPVERFKRFAPRHPLL